jgi:transcriptional regulator with XRE-family HTH domain
MPKTKPLEILVRLGANVRRERSRRGLTQEALAEQVELHPRMIQKIEAGQSNILVTTLLRLQAVLGCPWDLLLVDLSQAETLATWQERMSEAHGSEWKAFLRTLMLAWLMERPLAKKTALLKPDRKAQPKKQVKAAGKTDY